MRRTLVVGILLFLAFAVVFAPAGLLRPVLERTDQVALLQPSGTLWSGQGRLLAAGRPLGTISWRFAPVTILQGSLGYHVRLASSEIDVYGSVSASPSTASANADGRVEAAFVNQWLAAYDMALSGEFQLEDVTLGLADGLLQRTGGTVTWSGGPVRYVLSGRASAADLPPLVGYLGEGPEAVVFAQGGQTPLLRIELAADGFVKVGVTKLLTRMLNAPWPGSDPDHAVVLEVEQQLF
jgi:hypothetical protein